MSNNDITAIYPGAFMGVPTLEILSMRNNAVIVVGSQVFRSLTSLEVLCVCVRGADPQRYGEQPHPLPADARPGPPVRGLPGCEPRGAAHVQACPRCCRRG